MLTLSQDQLVSLDWHSPNRAGAQVMSKRILPGQAVEFDIHFPSNRPGYRSFNFVSSGEGGMGTLIGADIKGYETFALKLTLVSIDGQTESEGKEKIVVGALIGPTSTGRLSRHTPQTLSLEPSEKSKIAKTPMRIEKIYQIGLHVHMLNPQDWKPTGTTVVLRVQPVEGAGPVPWQILAEDVENGKTTQKEN
jgi:hypothetical protein